jgi:hypothetical protein
MITKYLNNYNKGQIQMKELSKAGTGKGNNNTQQLRWPNLSRLKNKN